MSDGDLEPLDVEIAAYADSDATGPRTRRGTTNSQPH